jgi:O-antigen/teichoic acid export membrane protein
MRTQAARWLTDVRTDLRRHARSSALQKIARNSGWLMGERLLMMLLALTIHVWLARHLGPTNFGVLSYAVSFVGLFGTFTYLGLSGVVIRDLVAEPDSRHEILGTVFVLKLAGGVLGLLSILMVLHFQPTEATTKLVIAVAALGLIFHSFRTIEFWFSSQVEARSVVFASFAAATGGAALNALFILTDAGLIAFSIVLVAQPALFALGLYLIYTLRGHRFSRWRFDSRRARSLLRQSWPLVLSSVGALIYLKVDQVMLGIMAGAEQVGTYAVAARLSEVWYFIPTALALSVFPKIVQSKREGAEIYQSRLQRIYNVLAVLSFAVAGVVTVASGPVIDLLYDERYSQASRILAIHIWTCPAMFMGAVLSKWLVAEGLLVFSFTRHLMGAVANVMLNLFLIPHFAGTGAAVATLISYTLASYFACFTDRRTRVAGKMMTSALLIPFTFWFKLVRTSKSRD